MSLEDVRKITASPMEHTLRGHFDAVLPLLSLMRCTVLCTQDQIGFITSDMPVTWFDPYGYKKPPVFSAPRFADPFLQITMPISPGQLLVLDHHDNDVRGDHEIEYVDASDDLVTEMNRRIRFHCHRKFVVRRKFTRPIWFDHGVMPPDVWGASHEDSAEDEEI
jgi:hypothetical protein